MSGKSNETDGTAVFRERSYARFWFARICTTISFQMASVAIGWQVYALTHSTFALGMVGLVQFLPMLLLSLLSGLLADRFDRKTIIGICQLLQCLTLASLAVGSHFGRLSVTGIYFAVAVIGALRAFEAPTTQALVPGLVERPMVPQAISWFTSATQTASIVGPAMGGFLYVFGAQLPYCSCAVLYALAAFLSSTVKPKVTRQSRPSAAASSIFSGIRHIRTHRKILGSISLDLFAVLLGGATALLPAFARDILHTGPWGLGILRLSPAVGALLNAVYLAHHPIRKRAGLRMFGAVIVFGLTTVLFGLSHNFLLSVGLLCVLGAADVTSVVVRQSLVQMETPDAMRGRVSAVNSLFIGTSNQLGQFESGVTASWFGVGPATVMGGLGSIAIALLWMQLFPALRQLDALNAPPPSPSESATIAEEEAVAPTN